MYETDDDLLRLQELLDRTLARTNPHLTSIVSPERRLSALQVVRYLMDGDAVGITVHGHATILEEGDEGVDEIDAVWSEVYGSSPFTWGDGVVFMVVDPTSMWTYAFHPENFPE